MRLILLGLLIAVALPGCIMHRAPVKAPEGLIYTHLKEPLDIEFHQTPVAPAQKTGESSTFYIFVPFVGIDFAWGRCDIQRAAANGNITKVQYADYEVTKVIIFGQFTVRVHGD